MDSLGEFIGSLLGLTKDKNGDNYFRTAKGAQDCTALVDAFIKMDEKAINRLKSTGISVDCWESEQGIDEYKKKYPNGSHTNIWFRPIHIFAAQNNLNSMSMLLNHGAKVNAQDTNGRSALHLAISKEMNALLYHRGADLNAIDNEERNPLHYAVISNDVNKAKTLLSFGAKVNGSQGEYPITKNITPLHLAAAYGHLEMATLLLQKGANVNAMASYDGTPLHTAVCVRAMSPWVNPSQNTFHSGFYTPGAPGQVAVAKLLIQKGANLFLLDHKQIQANDSVVHVRHATPVYRAYALMRPEFMQLFSNVPNKATDHGIDAKIRIEKQ